MTPTPDLVAVVMGCVGERPEHQLAVLVAAALRASAAGDELLAELITDHFPALLCDLAMRAGNPQRGQA